MQDWLKRVTAATLNKLKFELKDTSAEFKIDGARYPIIIMSEPFDEENILLKTYGTRTYAYCKRRNLYAFCF